MRGASLLPCCKQPGRGTQKYRQLMRQSKCMISGYQSLIRIALGWHTDARAKYCNKKRYKRLDKAWCSLCGPRPLWGPSLLVLDSLLAGRPRWLAPVCIVLDAKGNYPVIRLSVTTNHRLLQSGCVKVQPDYSGPALSRVDGFTSPIQSSAINRNHELEWFATVSEELSVHTGNSHPESLQHEC
jgi:hypothetical protein